MVQYGFELAPWGDFVNPRDLAQLAKEAEDAGWDGFFVWDAMYHDPAYLPKADAWIAMAAVAMATERIKFGPMVAALPRRRPWKLAREAVSLDQMSNGRLILGVGLGDPSDEEFEWFGEPGLDHKTRARMLDESLQVITGLWSGQPFSFDGEFYHLHEVTFTPTPVQGARIPIWVGGWWPNKPPMRRAARWDGVHPGKLEGRLTPDELRDLIAYVQQHREVDTPFDVAIGGDTSALDREAALAEVRSYSEAGATWWLEVGGGNGEADECEAVRKRILAGPPSI